MGVRSPRLNSYDRVTKQFGDTVAVDSLSFTVETGEVFGLVGPNGAGKSTLIDLILDYVRPTDGTVRVFGSSLSNHGPEIRSRMGVVPDDYGLVEKFTGRQHVELERAARDISMSAEEIVEPLDMTDALDTPVGEYSRGMKQRLLLSMAFAGQPPLLLLDEPATGLDPNGVAKLQELIQTASQSGTTVLVSSHRLERVAAAADRIGVLIDGDFVTIDSVSAIRERTGATIELSVELAEARDDVRQAISEIGGVENVVASEMELQIVCDSSAKSTVLNTLVRHGVEVVDFTASEPDLTDAFRELTVS
ncbi:ABC transporter ATP-binding protein [Halogeometricum borinquense]|uniref:ABC transporter ATP-binding protein n=1 Tax=Halogeometricum borinquense TaxID=60847 RepID=UPI0023BA7E6E|nr:ABC transporter ATP-binding protein [Halogeometricum borinquense]